MILHCCDLYRMEYNSIYMITDYVLDGSAFVAKKINAPK